LRPSSVVQFNDAHQVLIARYLVSVFDIKGKNVHVGLATHVLYTIWYVSRAIVSNEKTSALTTLHWSFGISRTIQNTNSVPIGLGTVRHEANKVWMWDTVAGHHVVEVLPEENLDILILRLKITA
jgi:hypothetical protein